MLFHDNYGNPVFNFDVFVWPNSHDLVFIYNMASRRCIRDILSQLLAVFVWVSRH